MLESLAATTVAPLFGAASIAALIVLATALFLLLRRRNLEIAEAHASLRAEIMGRMRADSELRAAKEAADEANRAKSRFLANMSHEIRTPLGAIIGFSELLMNPDQTMGDRAECLSAIRRNGELLSNIISDVLDLSKVEAGKFQIELQEADLPEVITDISSLLGLQAREKGILLTMHADPQVPERICTDAMRLRQVLVNIVGNAIKFTARGEVEIHIKMLHSLTTGVRQLAFVVRDTGPGITPEAAKRLFNLFSQGETKTHRPGYGTGLGLALSRRLAQLLGGDVVLSETTLGKGSVFTVTVDPGTVKTPKVEEFRPAVEARQADSPVRLDGTKVLVVDDSPDNQILITRFLRMAGAAVDVANNGREGLDKLGKGPFDVVIMDIQMPVMDGYEALAQLRGQGYRKPILALTAHALKEEQRRCLALGFDSHLSKPVNRHFLLEEVARFARQLESRPCVS